MRWMSRVGQVQTVSEHVGIFGSICLLVSIDIDLHLVSV